MSHELFNVYLHAAHVRMERLVDARFSEAVAAVQIGTVIAHDKKALRQWQRRQAKRSGRPAGLTGKALDQAMSGVLMAHPEFLKGVLRPRHLQPRSLWSEATKAKRKAKG